MYRCQPLEDINEVYKKVGINIEGGNPLCVYKEYLSRFKYIQNEHNNCTFCKNYNYKESYAYKTILTKEDIINCKKCFIREFGKKFEETIRREKK